ncbi:type I restriction-modification system subunit M [Lichenibacterium ramalinae]|uniref:type I restriction-modification system subunit M n=1 Tax=Lichenibacterium ramalinae TaxID=2316527 RepID=UPI001FE176DF|nr:class I SAM-dependent DNA methyltransferase [Lichenibacterium ramalinae]
MNETKVRNLAGFVWGVADLLRGDFKRFEYGKVILPFVILRRLDCLIADVRTAVAEAAMGLPAGIDDAARDAILSTAAGKGPGVYNTSGLSFDVIKGQEPTQVQQNLVAYLMGFSPSLKEIFIDKFAFVGQIERLGKVELLWKVFEEFQELDLSPGQLENVEMGYLFEDLIRRFSEISNETAGEHFTPREVIRLVVDLLTINDQDALRGSGIIRTVYDCAVGTGGMLAVAEERLHKMNDRIKVQLFGQELNEESFAICKSDMLVKGHDPEQIAFGNSLSQDAHRNRRFHYMLANPPYGVDWKKYAEPIKAEFESLGENGRFGAGLPRVSDGQLLFLQHMISKMREDEAGSRIAIVMNGSPLFTGGAGSGESEIRRWIMENDWLEAIVALPTDLFYNTPIQTYVWLLSNRKEARRKGKVQLIDASGEQFWKPLRRNLGSKRREIPEEARDTIVRIFHNMENGGSEWANVSKIFDSTDFGYREVRIERPLRLNYQASSERIDRIRRDKTFLKLTDESQDDIINLLTNWITSTPYEDASQFEKALMKASQGAGVKIAAPIKKAILSALSERDEEAAACAGQNGRIEADPELRDYELIPLKEDWRTYVAREVTPYVSDAWVDEGYKDEIDEKVGRVGYEISFNRYFYRREELPSLSGIEAELAALESDIAKLLQGTVA